MEHLRFLILSTTDWDAPQFGSRQQIARELAARGHDIVFVEVARALHSLISDPAGTIEAVRRMGRVRSPAAGLRVYTPPPVLPVYYHPSMNAVNQRLVCWYMKNLRRRLAWVPDVLWTYWPHTAHLVGRLGERVSVYHCIDDFTAVPYPLAPGGAIARMESEQCRKVDIVLARSTQLSDRARALNPCTFTVRGGVDVGQFDPRLVPAPRDDVAALPRPRAGLVGTLDDRIDVALVAHCARALPQASFVLVGPVKRHRVDLGRLRESANVYQLPPCAHAEVPGIVAGLDVCMIPYVVTKYTRALSPVKLYEYLAMGKPVVSTDLPYVRPEAANIAIAATAEGFACEISEALENPPSAQRQAVLRRVAEQQTWKAQVDLVEEALGQVLEAKG